MHGGASVVQATRPAPVQWGRLAGRLLERGERHTNLRVHQPDPTLLPTLSFREISDEASYMGREVSQQ